MHKKNKTISSSPNPENASIKVNSFTEKKKKQCGSMDPLPGAPQSYVDLDVVPRYGPRHPAGCQHIPPTVGVKKKNGLTFHRILLVQ